jgi:hypothetical protein
MARFGGVLAMGFLSVGKADSMNCGSAPLCGVLVIESGYGSGAYHQDLPGMHGLWPETGSYGTSQCIAPQDSSNPTNVYECYKNDGDDDLVSFEVHEWTKHGVCAGVKNADDYFTQMCGLADSPISIMSDSKKAGDDLNAMSSALANAGYEVFNVDTGNEQLYLSVCAGDDGKWKHSKVSKFSSDCGGSSPSPSPSPTPSPSPSPPPTPSPSPSPGGCPKTCSGYTCDEWYDYNGNTCAEEESQYGCDCSGCECPGDVEADVIA